MPPSAEKTVDTVRLRSLFELDKFVQSYVNDSETTDVVQTLEESLGCYSNYRKELKQHEVDYERAYTLYGIASAFLKKRITSFPDWERCQMGTTKKDKEVIALYQSLLESVIQDRKIESVRTFITDHSDPPNPFDFKHKGTLNPRQMKALLEKNADKILLIDFRSRDQFKNNHIRTQNIICIEPISIRPNYKDTDIDNSSLLTSPDHERKLFSRRDTFEQIIIYDENSASVSSEQLDRFYRILTLRAFEKPLKRTPILLEGGIDAWIATFGLSNFGHNHGDLSMPGKLQTRRPSQNNRHSVGIARSLHEYLSDPPKADFKTFGANSVTQQHNFNQLPRQQAAQLKRSNSIKLGSLTPKALFGTSTQESQPLTGPQQSQRYPLINPQNLTENGNTRSLTPQPALVSTSNSASFVSNLDTAKLHCTTGLCNLGNSCYMNCIIQCLLGTIPLMKMFYNGDYKAYVNINSKLGSKGIMARYFADLTQALFRHSESVYEPRNFKTAVGSLNPMFRNNDQQDCSEFLNFVLDGLHEDLNEHGNKQRQPPLTDEQERQRELLPLRLASTNEWERYLLSDFSAIVYLFQGQYASQLKCIECGTTSTTYQSFSVLSLPIPEKYSHSSYEKIPLEKCFEEFTKLEILDGDNRWHCNKCKQPRKSTKKITITRLPQNLIVHLKRFRVGSSYQKVTTFVDYPLKMDLTKYWPHVSSEEEAAKLTTLPLRGQTPPFKYHLYAVANHSGTLGSGHYTAFVWKGPQKKWCFFDDTKVSKNVPETAVVNPNAYVLFYARTQ